MSIEQEFFNQMLPIGGTPGMRTMVAVGVNPTGGVVDLNAAFGTGWGGGYLTLKADNAPSGYAVYVAASPSPSMLVRPGAVGFVGTGAGSAVSTGTAWPLLNGQEIRGRLPSWSIETTPTGPLVGYPGGYRATLTTANYIHYRAPDGAPTGMTLRILRSSVPWTMGPGEHLKAPT